MRLDQTLFNRLLSSLMDLNRFPGGNGEGDTPVPIPNTVVKPLIADGTAWATAWESRSSPGFFIIG